MPNMISIFTYIKLEGVVFPIVPTNILFAALLTASVVLELVGNVGEIAESGTIVLGFISSLL